MAMNVKFLKGVEKSLPTSRDSNTLYFVTDEGALYLGATLIGANFTSAIEAANAAIKVINDHGYVNSTEVGTAIGTALESYYTKTQIDSKIGTLKIGDTSYDTVVEYVTAKTTGIATDAVVAEKADKIKPVKSDAIAVLDYNTGNLKDGGQTITDVIQTAQSNTLYQINGLNAEKSSAAVEAGKGIQVTVKESAGKLTEVSVSGNYDNKYDAVGAAAAVLGNSNDAATANTVYGAKAAAAAAQSDATIAKTKIETFLGTVTPDGSQDIIDTLAEINSYVGEHGEEFAALSERVTKVENGTTVVAKANADKDGNEFSATYAKKAELGDLADKDEADLGLDKYMTTEAHNTFVSGNAVLQSGITATKVGEYDTVVTTVNTNKEVWDKAGTAVQSVVEGSANGTVSVDGTDVAVHGLGSAAYTDASAYDAAGTAELLVGISASVENGPTGVYAAIQGATTNTVKDCVDSINNIVTQLTWGTF